MNFLSPEIEYALLAWTHKNFTLAARRAGIQQAGFSRAIQRLEDRVGKKLFLRDARGVRATSFGEKFLNLCEIEKQRMQSELLRIEEKETVIEGTFRVGAHLAIALNYFPSIVAGLQREAPKVHLQIEIGPSLRVCELVERGELNAGIVVQPAPLPRLVPIKITKESVGVYSLSEKFEVTYYNPEMIALPKVLKKFKAKKLYTSPSYDLIARTLVVSPNTAGILPSGVADRYKQLKRFGPALQEFDICFIYREDFPQSPSFRELLRIVKATVREL